MVVATLLLGASVARAAAGPVVQFARTTFPYSSQLRPQQEGSRYSVMILQSGDAAMVPVLKAANPHLKILVYQAIMAAQNVTNSFNTCTNGPSDLTQHPSWMLKSQSGSPILFQNHYLMDVGNPAYQQACVSHAISVAKQGGFDGVFWDMVNAQLIWTLPSGSTVPQYPTVAAWQAAMYSMLRYMGPQLHAKGLLAIGNIGGSVLTPGLWQQWNGPLDGAEEESWTDDKTGLAAGIWAWPRHLANVAWSEASGKLAILHSWNTTQAGDTYGLASMLLIAGGESSFSTSNGCYSTCEMWWPEYTTAQQLGAPTGTYQQLAGGAYERWFQNGVVLVNPTGSSAASIPLSGGTYSGSGLISASSVGLGPTSGYILLRDGSHPASAPVDTSPPWFAANPVLGSVLVANPGRWSGSPAPSFSYGWSRCSTTSAPSCVPVPGATSAGYPVGSADVGHYLRVRVTGTNVAGSTSALSPGSARVKAPTATGNHGPSPSTRHHSKHAASGGCRRVKAKRGQRHRARAACRRTRTHHSHRRRRHSRRRPARPAQAVWSDRRRV